MMIEWYRDPRGRVPSESSKKVDDSGCGCLLFSAY